jgi:hypothetical protein
MVEYLYKYIGERGIVMVCPNCKSQSVSIQNIQTGSIGAAQNRVYIQPARRRHGLFYWMLIGWWWKPMWFLAFGWWWGLLFGGRKRGGLNFSANKIINKRVAICQNCAYQWNV